MIRVSILTPTHNRAHVIKRLYNSLLDQTNKNIEWVIVDDGSTDNTKEIIDEIIQSTSKFPIRYFYQQNQGKHIALNKLYDQAQGEYCFQIDDDDELLPTAVEDGIHLWETIPDKDRYWCICGRCVNEKSGKMVGEPWPDDINSLSGNKKKEALKKTTGEKCAIQKTDIVKKYKFPEIPQCKFLPEGILWKAIDQDFDQYYTDTVFRKYHQFEGECLSDVKTDSESVLNSYYVYQYMLSVKYLRPSSIRTYMIWICFIRMAIYKNPEIIGQVSSEFSFPDKIVIRGTKPLCYLILKKRHWL